MPRLSVILPVYNAEKYLKGAVDSVLAQTFSDWELLLVDDGSTDRSPKLCDRLAAADERICVLHQKNAGPGAARNRGVDLAEGEYVAFLDADDALDPAMYEKLFAALDAFGADSACCGYTLTDGFGRGETVPPPLPEGLHGPEEVYDGVVLPLLQDRLREGFFTGMVWRWLFRREELRRRVLRFPEEAYMEDELFLIRYFAAPQSLVCVAEGLYSYNQSPASLTRRYFPDLTATLLRVLEEKAALVREYALPVRPDWRDNSAWAGLLAAVGNEFAPGNPAEGAGAHRKNLKALCAVPDFARALKDYVPRGMNRRKALVAALLRRRRYGALTLLYTVKNRRRAPPAPAAVEREEKHHDR